MRYVILMMLVFLEAAIILYFAPKKENNVSDAFFYGTPVTANFVYKDLPMFECSWCHRVKNLNRHHIIPQSADKELKDVRKNLVVLCRDCHFVLGHRCNWKHFNPDVMQIVLVYTNTIISQEYKESFDNKTNSTSCTDLR